MTKYEARRKLSQPLLQSKLAGKIQPRVSGIDTAAGLYSDTT